MLQHAVHRSVTPCSKIEKFTATGTFQQFLCSW